MSFDHLQDGTMWITKNWQSLSSCYARKTAQLLFKVFDDIIKLYFSKLSAWFDDDSSIKTKKNLARSLICTKETKSSNFGNSYNSESFDSVINYIGTTNCQRTAYFKGIVGGHVINCDKYFYIAAHSSKQYQHCKWKLSTHPQNFPRSNVIGARAFACGEFNPYSFQIFFSPWIYGVKTQLRACWSNIVCCQHTRHQLSYLVC